jgi:hypothetical protein
MKKIIQFASLLSLVLVFTVAAASAQSSYGTDVEIPFAFNIGDHAYAAGNYILKVEGIGPGTAALTIEDTKTDEVQRIIMSGNGDEPTSNLRLVFETVDGQKYLAKVRTPTHLFAVAKTKAQKNAAKLQNSDKPASEAVNGGSVTTY